ncbi:MAG TPA: hypothetical protein ENF34_03850, partial [Candidatus Bathyarchaeota archaeon]|nr:hypothetical protein [Candidatus Bathyarchaeota archaeon]
MRELVIPTSCTAIDELLGGGLKEGTILLVYGAAGTGKTTLVLQMALNCSGMGHKALFVDCEGDLRAERIRAISGGEPTAVENLTIARPRDFEEQSTIIDSLEQFASAGLAFVAIDTMTGLYRAELSKGVSPFKLNRELNRQAAVMAEVARDYGLAVALTSQVRAKIGKPGQEAGEVEPVANRILRYWADMVICLRHAGQRGLRMAILEKGPSLSGPGPRATRFFRITEGGIV